MPKVNYQVPYTAFSKRLEPRKAEILSAVESVLDSGMFIMGPNVQLFEDNFAAFCGSKFGVGLANGTCSLHLAIRAMGIGAGDEVITAPNSFIASAGAIGVTGAKPVFVDIDEDLNIDPELIEGAITENTRAIMPVHLTGRIAKMEQILDIARTHELLVIEDAAQAVGAKLGGRKAGQFGDVACFSLHPLKNLHAFGDAGMLVTESADFADRIRRSRNHGLRNRDECEAWGFNCRLDEIQAAMLNVMLPNLDEWTEERRRLAKRYNDLLRTSVVVPREGEDEYHVYQTYVILADRRDALQAHLRAVGIEALIHYPTPIHRQPAASDLAYAERDFPVTMKMAEKILSLPLYPELKIAQQDYVVEKIKEFYANH
jgi:dTDP-4-amino-4,6-dideoxygalactose transaminase